MRREPIPETRYNMYVPIESCCVLCAECTMVVNVHRRRSQKIINIPLRNYTTSAYLPLRDEGEGRAGWGEGQSSWMNDRLAELHNDPRAGPRASIADSELGAAGA